MLNFIIYVYKNRIGEITMKKSTKRNLVLAVAIGTVMIVVIFIVITNFQLPDEYYNTDNKSNVIAEETKTVTISINCESVLDNYDKLDPSLQDEKYVPDDGYILKPIEYKVSDGDTPLDILEYVTKENKIQLDYISAEESSFGTAYVKGINHLYEYSCGEMSGWGFEVNGEYPNQGCSEYELKNGDVIEWIYMCSFEDDMESTTETTTEAENN